MRIVSGKFKGIRFTPPKDIKTRPTTDFAKENIFNTINNIIDFEDIKVLDLFAGTGNISYEFISRGVSSVTAIEMGLTQINFIKNICNKLKINNLYVYRSDVFRYIEKCKEDYDVIFADPPYQIAEIEKIPSLIFDNKLLKEEGILILEHGKNIEFADDKRCIDVRKYGSVHFSIFKNQ